MPYIVPYQTVYVINVKNNKTLHFIFIYIDVELLHFKCGNDDDALSGLT